MKLLFDFLPIILFFIVFKSYDDMKQGVLAATAVLIVVTVLQLAWSWWRHRKIERMPLIAAVLAVLLGGVTLVLQDEIYIKWKPTAVNWLFGVILIGSQYFGNKSLSERMMGEAIQLPKPVWQRFNMAWALFFVAMGGLNLFVAFSFATDTWVNFKLFGMLGLTLVFVVLQALYLARYVDVDDEPVATSSSSSTPEPEQSKK